MRLNIKEPVDKSLKTLNKQERDVLVMRFGLDGKDKKVLQEIADEFGLSRERIRQIQNLAIDNIRNDCMKHLSITIKQIEKTLDACNKVADENRICDLNNIITKKEKNYVSFLLALGDTFKFSKKTDDMAPYWYTNLSLKKDIDNTFDKMHMKITRNVDDVYNENDIRKMFKDMLSNQSHMKNYLNIIKLSNKIGKNSFDDWGYVKNPVISMNTLKGIIRAILLDANEPLHFTDIQKRVLKLKGSSTNVGSCHNELVRQDEFILVGCGLYGLESMGFKKGNLGDIIEICMKEKKRPISNKDLAKEVQKQRFVKNQSIFLVLKKDDRFVKDLNNLYYLAV